MTAPAQARGWVFTLNNPETNELQFGDNVKYAVWQRERGEQGTEHLQGYVEFKRAQRFAAAKKLLPRAHIEMRKGSPEQARAYSMKEDTRVDGPWEFGEFEKQQGRRSDLQQVIDAVKAGATCQDIAKEYPETYVRYHRGIKDWITQRVQPRTTKPKVIVRWGEAGSGKTRWVYDNYDSKDVYVKPDGEWFDGYVGQKVALFDDFYGGVKYNMLLRLLDRYEIQVPYKGGFVQWAPEVIVITSNAPPDQWYPRIADKKPLMRRLDEIIKVGDDRYEGHEIISHQQSITDSLEPEEPECPSVVVAPPVELPPVVVQDGESSNGRPQQQMQPSGTAPVLHVPRVARRGDLRAMLSVIGRRMREAPSVAPLQAPVPVDAVSSQDLQKSSR